jgi:hypothetical protein
MKKKKITAVLLPAALALVLAGGIHVGEALAYFTACTSASGRVQVGLNFTETETGDEVKDWTKHISIENTGVSECFVRVRVLAGEKYQKYLNYTSGREGSWELREDGYWYYDRILACGERTEELLAALDRALINQDTENGSQEEFNVIVVQEYTPVCYDEAGNPYADWTMKVEGADSAAVPGGETVEGTSEDTGSGAGDGTKEGTE